MAPAPSYVSPAAQPAPTSASQEASRQRKLEASRQVVQLFLRERTSDFSVAELAAHAGISERSFYRYFPRKEDVIRPFLDEGILDVIARIEGSDRNRRFDEVLAEAFASAYRDIGIVDWTAFASVFVETEGLRSTSLQVMVDGERHLADVVSRWLEVAPGSWRARLVSAVVLTAARSALEGLQDDDDTASPSEAFERNLRALGPDFFSPTPVKTSSGDPMSESRSDPGGRS